MSVAAPRSIHQTTNDSRVQCFVCGRHGSIARWLTLLHGRWYCTRHMPQDGEGD